MQSSATGAARQCVAAYDERAATRERAGRNHHTISRVRLDDAAVRAERCRVRRHVQEPSAFPLVENHAQILRREK